MTNIETAVLGVLNDSPQYRDLRDYMEEVLCDRISQYLMPELLNGVLTDSELSFFIIEEDLKHTAKNILEDMVGHAGTDNCSPD